MTGLRSWWVQVATDDIDRSMPKIEEYGSGDLHAIGRDLAAVAGRPMSDREQTEMGIWAYAVGKMARWTSALAEGRLVSDDTLLDLAFYVTMARRVRAAGSWPGPLQEDGPVPPQEGTTEPTAGVAPHEDTQDQPVRWRDAREARRHLVYLAGPIDQQGAWDGRESAYRALVDQGLVVFDPAGAWHVGPGRQVDRRLQAVNDHALSECDGVMALLPHGVPTIGTPLEISTGLAAGLPVVVVSDTASWALASLPVPIFSTVELAASWLAARIEEMTA